MSTTTTESAPTNTSKGGSNQLRRRIGKRLGATSDAKRASWEDRVFHFRVEAWDADLERTEEHVRRFEAGLTHRPLIEHGYESPEPLRRFLSSKRFQLLQTIWSTRPRSVYELAKTAERPRMAVVRDLAELKELMLVTFRYSRHRGRRVKKPIVPYDRIQIDIDLRQGERPRKDR